MAMQRKECDSCNSLSDTFLFAISELLDSLQFAHTKEAFQKDLQVRSSFLPADRAILNFLERLSSFICPASQQAQSSDSIAETQFQQRVSQFICWRREQLNQSNLSEFLGDAILQRKTFCSRVDVIKVDRRDQMKTEVVENWEGPLDRSVVNATPSLLACQDTQAPTDIIEQRLAAVESHLGNLFYFRAFCRLPRSRSINGLYLQEA